MLDRRAKRAGSLLEANNVRPARDAGPVTPERVVDLRTRTILRVILISLGVAVVLEVLWIARHILAWVVISLFLALALDPLVVVDRAARAARSRRRRSRSRTS